ncbi:MAG: hypothetical protein WDO14_18870 [Bacteroidota bacterium]
MKTLLRLSLVLALCFVSFSCFPQDYVILGDSVQLFGSVRPYGEGKILHIDEDRGHAVTSTTHHLIKNIFSLNEISEYRDGFDIYKVFNIDGKYIPYEEVVTGEVYLYKKGNHYLLKTRDKLTELRRSNFRSVLNESLDCVGDKKLMSNVGYSKVALKRIVTSSNEGTCDLFFVSSYHKFGIWAGYNWMFVSLHENQAAKSDVRGNSYSVGAFYEAPLPTKLPRLFFYAEIFKIFPYNVDAEYKDVYANTNYLTMTYQSTVVSPGFKLTTAEGSIKPYFKFAPAISFTRVTSPTGIRARSNDQKVIDIGPQDYMQIGFNTTVGVQIPVGIRKNIHAEIKVFDSYRNERAVYETSMRSASLIVGFSL